MSHIFLIFIIKFFPLKKKIKLKYKKLKCFFYSLNLFNKFIPKLFFINLPHHLKKSKRERKNRKVNTPLFISIFKSSNKKINDISILFVEFSL